MIIWQAGQRPRGHIDHTLQEKYFRPWCIMIGGEVMRVLFAHVSPCKTFATYIVKRHKAKHFQAIEIEAP